MARMPNEAGNEHAVRGEKSAGNRGNVWSTPALLAIIGLIGTGLGASMQGYWNTKLERHKFEAALIQKALVSNRKESAHNLKFLLDVGLLPGLNSDKVKAATDAGGAGLPIFLGAAIRDQYITIRQAKGILQRLTHYKGRLDDEADIEFRVAVMKFQRDKKLDVDGLIGPKTVLALWEACEECPGLLQVDLPPGTRAE